jgi:diguanylate cyclase (GGDEF)-like protein/PAS domain S-box-containing protein
MPSPDGARSSAEQHPAESSRTDERRSDLLRCDPLTGLASQFTMLERVAGALDQQKHQAAGPACLAVLSIGIDRLSQINHALTHRAGDQLIATVASRLVQALAGDGLLGRGTGDTFIAVLAGLSAPEQAGIIAERLRQGVTGRLSYADQALNPTVSIGLAVARAEANYPGADELLRDAALAMRLAGQKGRNRCQVADHRLALEAQRLLQLQEQLRQALESGELQAWLMPQVDLASNLLQGYEALVRWPQPDGQLSTLENIRDLARSGQLAEALDGEMLRQSIAALQQLQAPLSVAVNLSAETLARPEAVEQVQRWLEQAGVAPHRLHLEITETALLRLSSDVSATIQRLSALGVRWVVDGFGAGYSSISHLRDLPIHGLKLDGSFIAGVRNGDQKSLRLAQALAGLAESLGLDTVAEGIESLAEATSLRELGWRCGQGLYFGKAAPLSHWQTNHLTPWGASAQRAPGAQAAPASANRRRWALAVTDNVPVGLFALRDDGDDAPHVLFASRRWLELLELRRHRAQHGLSAVLARVHRDDRADLVEHWQRHRHSRTALRWEGRLALRGGSRWVQLEATPLPQDDGSLTWQGVVSDITTRKEQELDLQVLLDEAPIPIAIQELGGDNPRITFLNRQFTQAFGYELSTIPRLSEWARLAHPKLEQRQAVLQAWDASVVLARSGDGVVPPLEAEITTADGSVRRALFTAVVRGDAELMISLLDITAWRQAERQLQQGRTTLAEHALAITEAIPVGTYTMHLPPEGGMASFGFMSERFLQICGLNRETAAADPFQAFACVHPDDHGAWVQRNAEVFASKQPFYGECRVVVDGEVRWISAESVPRDLPDGSTVWEGVLIDISARKRVEAELMTANRQLEELASTDDLTGVSNRRHLEASIRQAIVRAERHGGPLSMLLCDLDHFKAINDRYGHPVGDQVLIEFCQRILRQMRSGDCFGRWGGEEFLILLDASDAQAATALADKLRRLISAQPFNTVGRVTASFGVAQWQPGESEGSWFQRADQGIYAAKEAGRDHVVCADPC